MDVHYQLRPAVSADTPMLAAIERRCFSDPWNEGSFREALGAAWTFGVVAESDQGIEGYLIARELAGAGEILNLAVAPDSRRLGIGRALLFEGLRILKQHTVEEVFLEVRESNHEAQMLYRRAGFRPVGQRPGYYRNPREDAIVLRLDLEARPV